MKVAFFFLFFLLSYHSYAECSKSDLCAKNLSLQVMDLTENILPITKEVFRENWYLILEKENLLKEQEYLNSQKSCKNAGDLIYAPKGSPLYGYGFSGEEKRYFFLSQIMKYILNEANYAGGVSLGIGKIYQEHQEWLKQFSRDELKAKKDELKGEFLKDCHEDKTPLILETYNDILSDHHAIAELAESFEEMKRECDSIYPEFVDEYSTGNRYSQNEYSSKFDTLKNIAELGCYPMNLVDKLFRDEQNDCNKYLEDIYEIINPECANKIGTDLGFLCNGLHDYLAKTFIDNPIYDEYLERFFEILDRESDNNSEIDLEKIALQATNNDAVAAWRIMALLGHDELNTTMKMIREELIRTGQHERFIKVRHLYTGEGSNRGEESFIFNGQVITLAPKFQNMKKFSDLIRGNGRFDGEKIEGRYYHYIAGGLVACELKARGHSNFRANLAATGTGVAYEAYDFESHTHVVRNSQSAHLGMQNRVRELISGNQNNSDRKKTFEEYSADYQKALEMLNYGNVLPVNLEEFYGQYSAEFDREKEQNSYWNRLKNTPWKDSFKNFYDDSSLHKRGGELGARMCQ